MTYSFKWLKMIKPNRSSGEKSLKLMTNIQQTTEKFKIVNFIISKNLDGEIVVEDTVDSANCGKNHGIKWYKGFDLGAFHILRRNTTLRVKI